MHNVLSQLENEILPVIDGDEPTAEEIEAALPAQPPPGGATKLPLVTLPGNEVTITDCAKELFPLLARSGEVFKRGKVVVTVGRNDAGEFEIMPLRPDAARSRFEKYAQLFAWRAGRDGKLVLKPTVCPGETAQALLACHVAVEILPPITGVVNCPFLFEVNGQLQMGGPGYHAETGLMVVNDRQPEIVPLPEAVAALKSLLAEFDFQSPGDYSRALASFITPALRMGDLIPGPVPADVAEADASQSGKTYRQKMVAALYGEKVSPVPEKKNGVGSIDEFFMERLVAGRPFIQFDNFRGRLDSPTLEAFFTCESNFPCRIAGLRSIDVDPTRFFILLSSNGVDTTRDFANRASIIRIRKRHGVTFKDTLGEIRARHPYYLGAVFAVVKAWHAAGKPRTLDTRHDFRTWAQPLDWIVQNIFQAAPLMDGHQQAQERVSNPVMNWLRAIALEVDRQGQLGQPLSASELYELGDAAGIPVLDLPLQANEDRAIKMIGKRLGTVFAAADRINCDQYQIERAIKWKPRPDGGGTYECKTYTFTKSAANAAQ